MEFFVDGDRFCERDAVVQKHSEVGLTGVWSDVTAPEQVTAINGMWERVVIEEPSPSDTVPKNFGRVEVVLP